MKEADGESVTKYSPTKQKTFTRREKEIIQLLALGKTNKEIGKILFISSETVKSHIKNLFLKTNTCSRAALVATIIPRSLFWVSTDESHHNYQIAEPVSNTGCH